MPAIVGEQGEALAVDAVVVDLALSRREAGARRAAKRAGDEVGEAGSADQTLADQAADVLLVAAAVAEILTRMQTFAGTEGADQPVEFFSAAG